MISFRGLVYLMLAPIALSFFCMHSQAANVDCKQGFIEGRFNCIKGNSTENSQKKCIDEQAMQLLGCRLKDAKFKPGKNIATMNRAMREIQIKQEAGIRACLPDDIESLSDRDRSLNSPPLSDAERDKVAAKYESCMLKNQASYREERIELGRKFIVISDDTIELEVDVAVQTPFGVTSSMITLYGDRNMQQKDACAKKNALVAKACNLNRKRNTSNKRKAVLVQLTEDYNVALDMVCAAAEHFPDKEAGRTWYNTIKDNYFGWCEDFEATIRGRIDGEWPRTHYNNPELTSCKRYKKQDRPLQQERCLCDFDCGT